MKPNLAELFRTKTEGDAVEATAFFGKPVNPAFIKKCEPGIDAAQRLVDAIVETPPPVFADEPLPPPRIESPILIPGKAENSNDPNYLDPAKMAEFIRIFRSRVKCEPDASPLDVLRAIDKGQWSRRVTMLVPVAGNINPWVHFGIVAQIRKQPWLGYHQEADTLIQRARNLCAQAFLKGESDWSWWHDADMICPFGDPAFFLDPRRLALPQRLAPPASLGVMAVDRLLSHEKSIVGGTYAQRKRNPKLVAQIDLRPRGVDDTLNAKEAKAKGPTEKLIEVDYVATGCALVHRKVYLDIMAKFPERQPKAEGEPFDFFGHDIGVCGEDISFGALAKAAGHQSYLDLGLFCAHVGNYAYWPGE